MTEIDLGFISPKADVDVFNTRLADTYGRDDLKRPRFRLVFSEDEYEKRIGNFKGQIGIELAKKYTYIKSKWVMEYLIDCPDEINTYEPFFVFQTKNEEALPVSWKALQKLVFMWLHREDENIHDTTPTEAEMMDTTYKHFLEVISGEEGHLANSFGAGEAIILPGKSFS